MLKELITKEIDSLNLSVEEADIRSRAYKLWEKDGKPISSGDSYWEQAKAQLLEEKKSKVSSSILKKLNISLQEASAEIQENARSFSQEAIKILTKDSLEKDNVILPDGVRFYRKIKNVHYVVCEQKPCLKTINVDVSYHRDGIGSHRTNYTPSEIKVFRIAVPYSVYFLKINENPFEEKYRFSLTQREQFRMFFNKAPISSFDEKLGINFLPNTHEERGGTYDGLVCCPFREYHPTLIDAINGCISFYWNSRYMYCLHNSFPYQANTVRGKMKRSPEFETWESYQKKSLEDPLFVLNLEYPKFESSLSSLLIGIDNEQYVIPADIQKLSSSFSKTAADILSSIHK